nr:MAG TPA: motif TRP-interacting helix [Caudoviricetes sp.]
MMLILKILKCLAYVFATSIVAMVLALFYWMVPVAILDLASQKPALVVFYQVTGIVAAATVLPTICFLELNSYENDLTKLD